MDLKEVSPTSMSDVLTFGMTKTSSFSLSKFMLELSLRVSESIVWFLSFPGIENILQAAGKCLSPLARGRKGECKGAASARFLTFYDFWVSSHLC